MRSPTELAGAFRAGGLKLTPQRQLLFSLLDGNTEHPTAEAIFARASAVMPGISLRTVYTTLSDLAEMGELRTISLDGGATRFDPNVDDHHHEVCTRCGAIADVYVDGADQLRLGAASGFSATSTTIVFHGECASCASNVTTSKPRPSRSQPAKSQPSKSQPAKSQPSKCQPSKCQPSNKEQ